MSVSAGELSGIMNEAFCEARTGDGKRLHLVFEPAEEELRVSVALFDEADAIEDMRAWTLPSVPAEVQAGAGRLRAFAAGWRRVAGTLDWNALYPEDFPAWPLLSVEALGSAEDFARVLATPGLLRDTLAAQWAEGLRIENGLSALPIEASRCLFALSQGTSAQHELEAHLITLARSQADVVPYLLVLLEQWADVIETAGFDDWSTKDGDSLRVHLATLASSLLTARVDAAQAERLVRLRERELIEEPPFDIDALFDADDHEGIPLETIEVGTLDLPSGKVVACDPFFADVPAVDVPIAPGRYPVRIVMGRLPDWGRRVLAARLDIAPGRALLWQRVAPRFGVDAGLACFMSTETRDAFVAARERFQAENPQGNYYTDVLAATLAPSATPERPSGDFGMHRIDEHHAAAVFSSGLGDGSYDVLVGVDAEGRALALAIDFGALP